MDTPAATFLKVMSHWQTDQSNDHVLNLS